MPGSLYLGPPAPSRAELTTIRSQSDPAAYVHSAGRRLEATDAWLLDFEIRPEIAKLFALPKMLGKLMSAVVGARAMLEIVATSKELRKQRRKGIGSGDVLCIGRQPKNGWAIPWDTLISREHVELVVKEGRINVRKLNSGRNEVHFNGKPSKNFALKIGEEFRIGKTTFEVIDTNSATRGVGTQVAHYRVGKVLGNGLLGTLVGANDQKTKRSVALRVFDASLTADQSTLERIVQTSYELEKQPPGGVANVLESGRDANRQYSAREFVQGSSLSKTFEKQAKIPPQRSIELIEGILRALQELHKLGLCHGNLKPNNVITRMGSVRLVDMSMGCPVATRLLRGDFPDGAGQLADYLAPELAEDPTAADIRSDLYSVGCIWWRMLTGEAVYPDGPLAVRLKSHGKLTPQWSRVVSLGLNTATIEVIRTLLSASPDSRFSEPQAALDALAGQDIRGNHVECPGCGKSYRVKVEMAGKRVTCKVCGAKIQIPFEL